MTISHYKQITYGSQTFFQLALLSVKTGFYYVRYCVHLLI